VKGKKVEGLEMKKEMGRGRSECGVSAREVFYPYDPVLLAQVCKNG